MKKYLNRVPFHKDINYHHEENHKLTPLELILSLLIAVISLIHLITSEESRALILIIPLLTAFLLYVKVGHIIKEKGTILEYTIVGVISIFLGLYIILKGNINSTLILVFIFILLYSAGLMIWLRSRITSKKITHFIVSYITTIFLIILLFAGAYTSSTGSFSEDGQQKDLKFREALYFSTITFTTVGYGDLNPLGINRAFAAIEALLGITINTALIGYILASGRNMIE